ncbi:MAG: tetratricopeptide repeat protein [Deltaproteobacteria bacterium]|nr:tetratricopeptide repeat protein [Deltaproteobacteria bacterium]
MNNHGFRSWIKTIGALRAGLLTVALVGKALLYFFNSPSFTSRNPLILPFAFLVALDFASAVVSSVIFVECLRILACRSTSSWGLKKHFADVFTFVALFGAIKMFFGSQPSNSYNDYGWSLAEKGDFLKAKLSLDIAIKYYPKHTTAYLERAYVHRRLSDFAAALNDCNKAVDLAPKNADTYACRGYTYYYLCDRDKALDGWNKAISLDVNWSGRLDKWTKAVRDPSYKCSTSG